MECTTRLTLDSRFLIYGALVLALTACTKAPRVKKNNTVAKDAPRIVTLSEGQARNANIQSVTLTEQSFAPKLAVYATINADPKHLAHVGPRMAGRITRVNVNLGDKVRTGQVLLEMDTIEFHETSKDYLIALARAQEADRAYERAKNTLAQGVGTQSEHDRAQANASAAAANLREAEEHLHALGLSDADIQALRDRTSHGSDHSHVRAPIDGNITSLDVSIGKVVSGIEDVITIAETSTLWATLRIYERDVAAVERGAAIEIHVTAYPDETFLGRLSFISDVVDPLSRTVEARAQLANPDGRLRPGMTGRAWITLKKGIAALNLPIEAVQKVEGANCIFVETKPNTYEMREVQVFADQGDFVSISSGVTPGDKVVSRGALILRGEWERAALQAE